MTIVSLSPVFNGQQFFDNNGQMLANGTITAYVAGSTSVLQTTYVDNTGNTANPNPIPLSSSGRLNAGLWLQNGLAYNLVVSDLNGAVIATAPYVQGVVSATATPIVTQSSVSTAIAGQTIFTLPFTYAIGSNTIQVFINGAKIINAVDYTESSTTSVTMAIACVAGDTVEVILI